MLTREFCTESRRREVERERRQVAAMPHRRPTGAEEPEATDQEEVDRERLERERRGARYVLRPRAAA